MNKKVSIVIPAYNVENYIKKCLISVVNQTMEEIEIIIVNDGSTDNTLIEIEKFKYDTRIKVINKKNEGVQEARKSGIKACEGEFVLFIDSDDFIELDTVEVLYNEAKMNNYDIVCYDYYVTKQGKDIKANSIGINTKETFLKQCLNGSITPNICFKLIKLKIIQEANFPANISKAEDLASIISIAICDPSAGFIDKALYHYVQREGSITRSNNSQLLDIEKALNFIKEELKANNLYYKYKAEYEYLEFIHMYYHSVIGNKYVDSSHKYMYKKWKSHRIKIEQNAYYIDLYNRLPNVNKIMIKVYNCNYYIGAIFTKIATLIKR